MPGVPVMPSGAGSGVPGEAGTPGKSGGLPGEKAFAEQGGLPGEGGVPGGAIGDTVPGAGAAAAGEAAGGSAVAGESAGAAGAEAAGAEGGMGMMPMTGDAGGGQDKERQRRAWMNEDDDIWGVPRDNVPPVIGG
jgi:hypothetical protein